MNVLASAAILLVSGVCASSLAAPPASAPPDVATARAKVVVTVLAADGMRGRGNGTPELGKARDLVRAWMKEAGAKPGAGEAPDAWTQSFEGPAGTTLENVIGRIAGSADEWVVVGAHYDHLGIGAEGESVGRVFPGADDNASGVAALLHVTARLAAAQDLRRGVLFVAFAGEEIGLLGSRAFVAAPPVPLEHIVAMLNFDTVGRMRENRLIVFGSGTAEEFPEILRGVNFAFGLDLALNAEGSGASDQTPFFEKGVPVLHFFTGANPDYHRPTDTAVKVAFDGIVKIADFAAELVLYLATTDSPLTFKSAGVDKVASRTGGGSPRRVSLGTIPDFAREKGGVLLQGVMPNSAAEDAGLRAGDLLVAIGETAIDTIDDFQAALAVHAPGDRVAVRYERAGETRMIEVVLRERK